MVLASAGVGAFFALPFTTALTGSVVLMSSHRDYDNDKQWSWLRNHNVSEALLRFEPVEDSEGMYELIVGKDWSTLVRDFPTINALVLTRYVQVVSNRDDGSFATGDLYEKHTTICNAWRYAGRVDDMIVLVILSPSASPTCS